MMRCSQRWGLLVMTLLAWLLRGQAQALPPGTFQYVSPLPGSCMVLRETNIIIRHGEAIDPVSAEDASLLSVAGAGSGAHPGRLTISDDGRSLIFVPDQAFQPGELVTVHLRAGIATSDGRRLGPLAFQFTISSGQRGTRRHRNPFGPGVRSSFPLMVWSPTSGRLQRDAESTWMARRLPVFHRSQSPFLMIRRRGGSSSAILPGSRPSRTRHFS